MSWAEFCCCNVPKNANEKTKLLASLIGSEQGKSLPEKVMRIMRQRRFIYDLVSGKAGFGEGPGDIELQFLFIEAVRSFLVSKYFVLYAFPG